MNLSIYSVQASHVHEEPVPLRDFSYAQSFDVIGDVQFRQLSAQMNASPISRLKKRACEKRL